MQRRTPLHHPLGSDRSIRSRVLPAGVVVLLAAGALATAGGALPASAAAAGSVTLYPSDSLTVADATQLTGRRIALPTDGCTGVTTCGLVAHLNQLDGFDLDPRLALHFSADVDVNAVIAATTLRQASGAGPATGIDRVVYDSATHTVYAHPQRQLTEGTNYRLSVARVSGLPGATTTFTTMSATDQLVDLRGQLDSGKAYTDAGIPAGVRGLQVDATVPISGTTFTYVQDEGSKGGLVPVTVPTLASGTVVFGSYLAPSWLRADRTIRQVPSAQDGPDALGRARLPFVLVLPPGKAPAGGWPTAVFGHGFTRSDADVLLAATVNSNSKVATIATDVVGHGYGPRSTWSYSRNGVTKSVPAYGRGVDLDTEGDGFGFITSTEGSSTVVTGAAAAVSNRDGLRQTVLDDGTLVRAVERGLTVGSGTTSALRPSDVSYFGQSFGGIYGAMLAGADPTVSRAALNVAGGPVTEIARLSPSFRLLITQSLQIAGLLNSTDPDKDYFDESLPLRGAAPVLAPAPGALPIQDYLAQTTWLDRSGSPEAYAPLIRPARTIFQVAFGDQTVPNPTAYTLLAAGNLFDRATLYRNDRTPSKDKNPHGFLLDPINFPTGFFSGQREINTFLTTGKVVDPDGSGDVFVTPVYNPAVLLPLNFTSPTFPGATTP